MLKQGLSAYEKQALEHACRTPYEIYRELDLGEGGYALAPARSAKSAIADVIRRKRQQ